MSTAKGNMLRNRIRPHILVLVTLVIISIDVYCDRLFFSPVFTLGEAAHVLACSRRSDSGERCNVKGSAKK